MSIKFYRNNNHLEVFHNDSPVINIDLDNLVNTLRDMGYQITEPVDPLIREIKAWIDTLPTVKNYSVDKVIVILNKKGRAYLEIYIGNSPLFRGYVTSLVQAQTIWDCTSL